MRRIFEILSIITLIGIVFFVSPSNSFADTKENNEYIKQYYLEHNGDIDLEEEKIILEALESYWEDDLKVAEVLTNNTQDTSIKSLVLSTDPEDKIKAIEFIKSIYENVSVEEQELLHDYVARHYKGTEDPEVQEYLETLDSIEKEEQPQLRVAASYNGTAAGNWAYNNYNKYSKNYPKFTGDFGTNCTNFVSQAMHVGGGIPKQGTWTISRKNTKYHVINSAAQLNYSWKLSDPSPWISVKEFSKYWRSKSSVKGVSNAQYVTKPQNYRNQKVGDIVIFSKGVAGAITVPTHAMIITQKPANDYNLAGNSVERQKLPLKTAIKSYSYIEFYRPN